MDTSLFPIGMEKHIIFAVVAGIFFLLQFFRTKYWYELILAVAVPFSLLVFRYPWMPLQVLLLRHRRLYSYNLLRYK